MLISLNMLESLFLKPRRLETRASVEGGAAGRLESPRRRKGAESFLNENTLSLIIAPSRALKRGERALFSPLFFIFFKNVAMRPSFRNAALA